MLIKSQVKALNRWWKIGQVAALLDACCHNIEDNTPFLMLCDELMETGLSFRHATDLAHWLIAAYEVESHDKYQRMMAGKVYGDYRVEPFMSMPVAVTLHKPAIDMPNGARVQSTQWRKWHRKCGDEYRPNCPYYSPNAKGYFAIHADCVYEIAVHGDNSERPSIWWCWDHYGLEPVRSIPASGDRVPERRG